MIVEERTSLRTPIEQMLLNEMVEEDTAFIVKEESEIDDLLDDSDEIDLFDNDDDEISEDDLDVNDLLDEDEF